MPTTKLRLLIGHPLKAALPAALVPARLALELRRQVETCLMMHITMAGGLGLQGLHGRAIVRFPMKQVG